MKLADQPYFLPYQRRWILDKSRLRIIEKGRQTGLSYADSYDSVCKASIVDGKDVWVMSRDDIQAKQYILYCKKWSKILQRAAEDLGEQILNLGNGKAIGVQVLRFASGACIYALSSNPDAIVGKTGHVKLDEFAIHKAQRELYALAKPVTQWGGTLSIISTHRGIGTMFNRIITDIKEHGNPMGWSLHTVPIQKAVDEGLVERINAVTGGHETREEWLKRQRAECIDEEQWKQEYCCIPADENTAFISYEMINGCTSDHKPLTQEQLKECQSLYVGMDVARTTDLCVIDIGQLQGDTIWDAMRIEMRGKTFTEIKYILYQILRLPTVKRCCIDATGLGMQLAEQAHEDFGYKVEPVTFTNASKADMAFGLRQCFEDKKLRLFRDEKLVSDLRGIKKEKTAADNIRFAGESEDSHCDRFWALALRQYAHNAKTQYTSCLI